MAKKAQKRSAPKKAASKSSKSVRSAKPTAKAKPAAKVKPPAARPLASARPAAAPTGLSHGEQLARLRDEILRSKLTHPDPWRYAPKARAWGEQVEVIVIQTGSGSFTPAALRALDALAREVEADRDFQEARRLF